MKKLATVAFVASVASAGLAKADTVYDDAFARIGTLTGTNPAPIDTPIASWTANTSITTTGSGAFVSGLQEGYLPLDISTPGTYTLTATVTPNTNGTDTSDWLALGFSNSMTTSGTFWDAATPAVWVGYRENGGVFGFTNGLTTAQTNTSTMTTSPGTSDTFTISVDTIDDSYTVSDSLGIFSSSGTTSSIADITGIAIGAHMSATGIFSDLTVTNPVPEPASLGVIGLSVLAMLRRRARLSLRILDCSTAPR
jgi:hypothetical protein